MSTQPPDPRSTITPDAFAIAPDLIGLPLARPFQRLLAILLDLIPVAVLANTGWSLLLGGLAAVGVWRGTGFLARVRFLGFIARAAAALFVFGAVAQVASGPWYDRDSDREEADAAVTPEILELVPPEHRTPEVGQALAEARAASEPGSALSAAGANAVILAYAAALERSDSAAIDSLQESAERAIAGPRIDRLNDEQARLQAELQDTRSNLEEAEAGGGIRRFLTGLADDLGIGFGWSALYFTAFLVLGRGQTPGKRLMGIRVIRLDGKPIGWWYAFERFGTYFASFTTGLVGFVQIFWDRNRQALHDKVVETVVVRVRKAPPIRVRTR